MKKIILLLFISVSSLIAFSQSLNVFYDKALGRYGINDKSGNIVLKAKYNEIISCNEYDTYLAKSGETFEIFNNKGEKIAGPFTRLSGRFDEGIFVAATEKMSTYMKADGTKLLELKGNLYIITNTQLAYGMKGIYNTDGKMIVEGVFSTFNSSMNNKYFWSKNFSDDPAKQGFYGINNDGTIRFFVKYPNITDRTGYSEKNLLETGGGNTKGLMTTEGKEILPAQFSDFILKDNFIIAYNDKNKAGIYSYAGVELVPPVYKKIERDMYSSFYFLKDENTMGLVSGTGKIVLPARYSWIEYYGNNLFKVRQDNKSGLADTTGVFILGCEYYGIERLGEKLYSVYNSNDYKKNNRCGLFNPETKAPVDYKYSLISNAGSDCYITETDSLKGLLDKNGRTIKEPVFQDISKFLYGKAKYKSNGLYGVIDSDGAKILSPVYANLFILENGYMLQKGDATGWSYITDLKDSVITTTMFEDVKNYTFDFAVKMNGRWGSLSYNGEILAECEYDSPFTFGLSDYAEAYFNGKAVNVSKVKFTGLKDDECYVMFWTSSTLVNKDKPVTINIYNYPQKTINTSITLLDRSSVSPNCATESVGRIILNNCKYYYSNTFIGQESELAVLDLSEKLSCHIIEIQ